MTNFQRTADWLLACGKTPGDAQALSVQIGCDLEETAEYLLCLTTADPATRASLDSAILALQVAGLRLKAGYSLATIYKNMRAEALDALCDREVTGNGVAFLALMDKQTADRWVLDSNDAKLVDGKPVILDGGKIGKPEGWKAPDLTLLV